MFSCSVCEECTTVTTTTATGVPAQVVESTFEACGSDIRQSEGTITSTASSGGITATSVSVTTCRYR